MKNLNEIFSFKEFYPALIKSGTARRNGIDNTPKKQLYINNLVALWDNVICPVADHYGPEKLKINSVYRCLELNRLLKSKDTSQHIIGEAVDFEIIGHSNKDLFDEMPNVVKSFDQLILEFHDPENGPNDGWVHCSFKSVRTRNRHHAFKLGK